MVAGRLHFILSLALVSASTLNGQNEIQPTLNQDDKSIESIPETPRICAIVILNGSEPLLADAELENIPTVLIQDVRIPGNQRNFSQMIANQFLGQPLDKDHLAELKQTLLNYYYNHHRKLVEVVIPEQEIVRGIIQIRVFEGQLGAVKVEGNCWTRSSLLKKQLGIKQGDPIDEERIRRALNVINRNPFHVVNAIYDPGKGTSETDITLSVEEKRPIRLYLGGENNGVRFAGRQRWFAGLNWGNAFGLNHIFTYQYITANQISRFQAHTVQYVAPLSNDHILSVYGGYSYVHPKESNSQSSKGYSAQASFRYSIPFAITDGFAHELIFGGDFKATNTVVEYLDVSFAPAVSKVNLTQLMGGYQFQYHSEKANFLAKGELLWSPGSWLPDQSNARYNALRPGATHTWLYGRALVDYTQTLPHNFNINFHSLLQYATNNLIPSEQLGIGGYDTVRGYDERLLSKESGAIISFECRFPALHLASQAKIKDHFVLLAFCDYGWGINRTMMGTWTRADSILGIGPGIRYQFSDFLQARVDWGFRLLTLENPKATWGNFAHISVNISKY